MKDILILMNAVLTVLGILARRGLDSVHAVEQKVLQQDSRTMWTGR